MHSNPPQTLICTVGTSLFKPNLEKLPDTTGYERWLLQQPEADREELRSICIEDLRSAYQNSDWKAIADLLLKLPGRLRLNGAEINSIDMLIAQGGCSEKAALYFLHSDTPEGCNVVKVFEQYYRQKKHCVTSKQIPDLQDQDPKRFRTKGLRNLAKEVCSILREMGSENCAINATGGYKAQIAIATLVGQALTVPVYYKHEHFTEIIAFPPMPISLDYSLWLRCSGWLALLDRENMLVASSIPGIEEDWTEAMETLIDRELEGSDLLYALSATGQIFYETFKEAFGSGRDKVLPPEATQQREPNLTSHNWGAAWGQILEWLTGITNQHSYVYTCRTYYWNPNLPEKTIFRVKGEQIEGIFSNGTWTVKFYVETSSTTEGQRAACVADLNQWLFKK
jgi:putative CRISPR-associated protein (TIGR02619 family)